MSRFAAAALLLPTVIAVLSEDGSRRQCPDGCNGHGRCWFWLHEPHFPALCICDQRYEGSACERRQPNPYVSQGDEALKYKTWQRDAGFACGGGRSAKSCSDCVPPIGAGDVAKDPQHKALCGGECGWIALSVDCS